jgi:hypothetical protein
MTDQKKTWYRHPAEVSRPMQDMASNQLTAEQWFAIRKEAGLKIDPETAEVCWTYGNTFDPYGVYPDLEDEQIGREYFALIPGSDVWVLLRDLPKATSDALWEKHGSKFAFPAGLDSFMSDDALTRAGAASERFLLSIFQPSRGSPAG